MNKGDLVRIKTLEASPNDWGIFKEVFNKTGVILEFVSWHGYATVLVSDGEVRKFRAADLQLIKRSPENKERLMSLGKIKHFPYQIYCDMDGVLVDFEGAATKSINEALSNPPEGTEALCEAVRAFYGDSVDLTDIKKDKRSRPSALKELIGKLFEEDVEWWANLPFLEEGKKLWSVISKIEPTPMILTSPMDRGGFDASEKGKIIWVKKNLGTLDNIEWGERVRFSHNKYEYAMTEGKPNVLIDDYPRKVDPFNENGGYGILHKGDSKETIEALKEIFDGNLGTDLEKTP
tara:strand:+ start:69 stop:941 length:873 start_codon:yes stop_codon:yes gene_type:complete